MYLFLILWGCMIGVDISAHDIEVPNADGVTIYYNYINNNTELAVTCPQNSYDYIKYSGIVVIPEEVTFDGRTLKVTSIENYAFYRCSELTSVSIPNSVTTIGENAFYQCSGLISIDIGDGVTSIGRFAFYECTSLPSVTIGNSVTVIENVAFYGCSGLKSITIPPSVTRIGNYVFEGCYNLKTVNILDLEAWCNLQSSSDISRHHLYLNGKKITSLIIPESVTSIGKYAFSSCYGIISVIIPNSVTSIGYNAFSGCTGLRDMYCYARQLPETGAYILSSSNYTNATLHVPAASVSAYRAVEPWKSFKEIVALPAQDDYRPFVEEGKVWKVGTIGSGNPVQLVNHYYFDADTIVNGKVCKQMMCQRYVNPDYVNADVMMQYPLLSSVGAWYEENKKVYIYDSINDQFKLMYDFSVDANDTLEINNLSYVVGPKQTEGLKGFKGVYRDVKLWADGESIYSVPWLEGVGSIDCPTTNVYPGYVDPAHFLMLCTVGDEVIYLNDEYEDGATPEIANATKGRFDFTHTIKTQPKVPMKRDAEQSLYGEYSDLQLSINLNPIADVYLVRITDEMDNTVYEKAVNANGIVGLSIDISTYAKGRYTVTVENSHETFTGEFETQTAGIEEVRDKRSDVKGHIYNLQGQRISSLRKGLNIVNGRKVYIK